jgi:NRPS condensation-like uncharacterized protein
MDKPNIKDSLKGLIKTTPETPIQEIKPVKGKEREGFHINAWIPEEYEKPIKRYCVEHDITIREFIIQAVDKKLNP